MEYIYIYITTDYSQLDLLPNFSLLGWKLWSPKSVRKFNTSRIRLLLTTQSSQIVGTVVTSYSWKILSHSIIYHCAVFGVWWAFQLMDLSLKLDFLDCISCVATCRPVKNSSVPVTTCSHDKKLMEEWKKRLWRATLTLKIQSSLNKNIRKVLFTACIRGI